MDDEDEIFFFQKHQQLWPLRAHPLSVLSGLLCVFYRSLALALPDILNFLQFY